MKTLMVSTMLWGNPKEKKTEEKILRPANECNSFITKEKVCVVGLIAIGIFCLYSLHSSHLVREAILEKAHLFRESILEKSYLAIESILKKAHLAGEARLNKAHLAHLARLARESISKKDWIKKCGQQFDGVEDKSYKKLLTALQCSSPYFQKYSMKVVG